MEVRIRMELKCSKCTSKDFNMSEKNLGGRSQELVSWGHLGRKEKG